MTNSDSVHRLFSNTMIRADKHISNRAHNRVFADVVVNLGSNDLRDLVWWQILESLPKDETVA